MGGNRGQLHPFYNLATKHQSMKFKRVIGIEIVPTNEQLELLENMISLFEILNREINSRNKKTSQGEITFISYCRCGPKHARECTRLRLCFICKQPYHFAHECIVITLASIEQTIREGQMRVYARTQTQVEANPSIFIGK